VEFGFVYKLQQVPRLESPLSNITQKNMCFDWFNCWCLWSI